MAQEAQEEPWPVITKEERILHEILFFSQGPVDGYILGDEIRNLLLKSGLSLTTLSQLWDLADVTNDNVLNIHEFVLVMHLIRGVAGGRAVPKTFPRGLTPPKTTPQNPPPMTQQEKDAYLRVFQTLDNSRAGVLDDQVAAEMFLSTKLSPEVLAQVWDLSDFNRDGKLNPEKFAIACHLLRYVKQGGSLDGPIDIFKYIPQHISPLSLLARKRRVAEYEEHKQRLMSLKERRKVQAGREARRLDLCKQKVQYLQQLSELLKNLSRESEIEGEIMNTIQKDMADNTKQEEIALRLKKEHEKVRQETVKIILGEQKFNNDISSIKKDTDELNKRLLSLFTHATKDTDPFHQLYEHRREKRQGSTIKDLDKIDIYIPFDFSPFDLNISPETLPSGIKIISEGTNQKQSVVEVKSVIEDLKEFGDQFMDLWGEAVSSSKETTKEFEDDEIFKEVHDWTDDNWPSLDWSENGMLGITDTQVVELKQKLVDIREELQKLSSEGGRLVFRNPDDYYARKKAIEEEENAQKGRVQRRSVTERFRNSVTGGPRARDSTNRYSYSGERRSIADSKEATQLAREYRLRRRSQNFDSASSSPEIIRNIDRDRRLPRAYTDPASGSDEASLSRESSLSSIDQAVSLQGSSPKLEEESSTIRTHYSSKTDDSGISTFRSNTRKDDSCSESSLALISSISSDSAVTTVPLGRTKWSEVENKTSQTKQSQGEGLSSVSVEPKKKEKRPTNFSSVGAKNLNKPTLPETARNPLNKQTALDFFSPVAPTTPSWDKSTEDDIILSGTNATSETHVKSTALTTSAEGHIQSCEDTDKTTSLSNHKPNLVGKKPEGDTYILTTETLPSRPPRVKKQSLTTETSKESSSSPPNVTVAGDSVFAVKEIYISRTHDTNSNPEHEALDKKSVTKHTEYQLKSGSNTVKQTVDLISERSNRILQQSSPNLNSSYDQNITEQTKSPEQRQKNKEPNTNEKTIVTETLERSKDKITGTYSEKALTGSRISETGPKGSHYPESKLKGSCLSEIGHNETSISKTVPEKSHTSIKADASNFSGVSMETLAPKFGDISDSDTEGGPPPLPDSAPPPLPAGQPHTTSAQEEAEEEVVTVEYTVPIAQINGDHSFSVYSTKTETSSPESSVVSISSHTSGSSVHNEIDKAPQSTSKTISDLRSDFFGIKPRSSSTETTPDVTATVVRESHDASRVEAKISEKSSTSTPQPSDTTNFGADKPSTGDTTKRTKPNDDHTRERTPSTLSKKKLVPPNDSIEPTLEISLSSSISSSPPTVLQSKNPSPLPTNAESLPAIKKQSSSTERSVDVTVDISGSKKIDENANKVEETTKKVDDNAKKVEENAKKVEENAKKVEKKTAKKVENTAMKVENTAKKVEENAKKENDNTKKVEENIKKVEENSKKVNDNAKKVEENPAKDEISAELAKERRTVISESAVKRKIISSLTPSVENEEDPEESLQNVGKSVKSSNPSEYGFVYSAERPVPPPEAFWSDKLGDEHKVNLYSENVVKEGNTTESVDRESIADLVTTKRQWENIFTVQGSSPSDTSAKKKASPKWSVRLPYTEKPSAPSTGPDQITEEADNLPTSKDESPAMFKKPVNTESAIEREIRLAHEREEMLRKELEERLKLSEKPFVQSHQGQTLEKPAVQSHQGQSFIASYTASNAESESFQPAYNELTEADRDPELWGKERNKIEVHEEESITNGVEVNPNESIIEREIRLQREREAEVAKMRKTVFGGPQSQPVQEQHVVRHPEHHNHKQHEEQEEVSHNKTKGVVKEQGIVTSPQTVENLIARELQELKEREEEVKRLHVSIHGSAARIETLQTAKNDASPKSPTKEGSWQRDVSPFILQPRRESIDSASSHSTGGRTPSDHALSRRDVRVKPIADGHSDSEEQKPDYFQKQETPIEREMRVARERENELRKQKGLPELNHKEENPYGSYNTDHDESHSNDSVPRPQSLGQPENSMKKYASNRLQQELQQQKERELALRSEGKILTTSEEHIQPLKFIDIAGSNNNNEGASKRNFTTRKSTSIVTNNEPDSPQVQQEILSPSGSGQPAKKAGATGAGGRLFSYREFKQSAESKIERELREMKEREEELR